MVLTCPPLIARLGPYEAILQVQTIHPGSTINAVWSDHRLIGNDRLVLQRHRSHSITDIADGTGKIVISPLQPNRHYQVILQDSSHNQVGLVEFRTPRGISAADFKENRPIPGFKMVTGSCFRIPWGYEAADPEYNYQRIYQAMQREAPDLMLMLGDNIYADLHHLTSLSGLGQQYQNTRNFIVTAWQKGGCGSLPPTLAVIDDHEMSPNNGLLGDPSERLGWLAHRHWFPAYTDDMLYPVPSTNAWNYRYQDVAFFGLDLRSQRTTNQIMGEDQLQWFLNGLLSVHLSERGTFIFVMSGSPFLTDDEGSGNWSLFPEQRQRVIDWITKHRIPNIIFLTGDSHYSDLSRYITTNGMTIYDYRSSPVGSTPRVPSKVDNNRYRVPGSLLRERNFGSLELSGSPDQRSLIIKTIDDCGQTRFSHTVHHVVTE